MLLLASHTRDGMLVCVCCLLDAAAAAAAVVSSCVIVIVRACVRVGGCVRERICAIGCECIMLLCVFSDA